MKAEKDVCWSPGSASLSGAVFIVYTLNKRGRVMWWHPDKTHGRKTIFQSKGLTSHTPQNKCRQRSLASVNLRVFFFFYFCYDAVTTIYLNRITQKWIWKWGLCIVCIPLLLLLKIYQHSYTYSRMPEIFDLYLCTPFHSLRGFNHTIRNTN